MTIELSEFYQTFFDEASEHLATMESLLLELSIEAPDIDDLNAIFRSAHSIKGGAGMFGFTEMTEVTHILETLLDRLRKQELHITEKMVDAFLEAADILKGQIAARQGGQAVEPEAVVAICAKLKRLTENPAEEDVPAVAQVAAMPSLAVYEIRFSREGNQLGDPAPFDWLLDSLSEQGKLEVLDRGEEAGKPALLRLTEPKSLSEVRECFSFFVQPDQFEISSGPADESEAEPLVPGPVDVEAPAVAQSATQEEEDLGFGFFTDIEPVSVGVVVADDAKAADPPPLSAAPPPPAEPRSPSPAAPPAARAPAPAAAPKAEERVVSKAAAASHGDTSIRVNIEKVDQLINLAGELVITQAMLAQTASEVDPVLHESLINGIALLERNTRDLQEAVMSIRMMPMSFVFSRFPRMVRDLAAKFGKEINFKTFGENTELDKGVIEKITDPLTHLVRNSLDHGIEMPQARADKGKDRKGNLTLRAFHQGGNVVIEVEDDGGGLNRDRIMAKARERGLPVSDGMPDQDVWQLIMMPGFSTAEVVTDVSGRGVGMDVVKKNIESLNGRVEIESKTGAGTKMTIRLPLTLAILDGLSIAVGQETFIIPLTGIIESLQPRPEDVKSVAGQGRVVHVRGEYLPMIALYQAFNIKPNMRRPQDGTLMIVEADGIKAALLVDELLGQHQVVIKSLETNYRRVPGISGATIMGDGRVALILDVTGLVRVSKTFTADGGQDEWALCEPEIVAQGAGQCEEVPPQADEGEGAGVWISEDEKEAAELLVLENAIHAHTRWKTRLRVMLDGGGEKLDRDAVSKDNACDLGKWIYGEGKKYTQFKSYKELLACHQQFHRCAAEVVRKHQDGDSRSAENLLSSGGAFVSKSTETVSAIKRLEKELHAYHAHH